MFDFECYCLHKLHIPTMKQFLFLILSIIVFCNMSVKAQVTIGSGKEPVRGSLLDLEQDGTFTGNANSEKGLGLPRVALQSRTALYPMLSVADTISKALNADHTGLVVYNINENLCKNLFKGLHVWDGNEWDAIGNGFPAEVDVLVDKRDPANPITYHIGKFGDNWWMLENLRATQYDTGIVSPPTLKGPWAMRTTTPYWCYPALNPNPYGTGLIDGADPYYFNQMKEMGFLYNWFAATGTIDISSSVEGVKYQGICPNGWHIPNVVEQAALIASVTNNPCLHGNSASTADYVRNMKSPTKVPLSATATQGASRSYAEGGFNALLAGYASGNVGSYGATGYFWSSIAVNGFANYFALNVIGMAQGTNNTFNYFSVRCVKN